MMRKFFLYILVGGVLFGSSACLFAVQPAFSVSTRILPGPMNVAPDSGLNFGTLKAESKTPVTVAPASANAAHFTVQSNPSTSFTAFVANADLSKPISKLELQRISGKGANELTVDQFQFGGFDVTSGSGGKGSIGANGERSITVGATLHPTGNEQRGAAYHGEISAVFLEQ